jgi:hypothetical protein
MHLRKLAWATPLLLAASAVHAEGSGSFLEGAKLAALTRPETTTPAAGPSHRLPASARTAPQGQAPASPTSVTAAPAPARDADADPGTTFEIRNFLTLVVALALVGWIQRRRRDA